MRVCVWGELLAGAATARGRQHTLRRYVAARRAIALSRHAEARRRLAAAIRCRLKSAHDQFCPRRLGSGALMGWWQHSAGCRSKAAGAKPPQQEVTRIKNSAGPGDPRHPAGPGDLLLCAGE